MCRTKKCSEDFDLSGGGAVREPSYNDFEPVNEIRIVLIGRTGSGKSATENSIMGEKHFESLVSGSSVTNKCKRGETFRRGKKIIVVDTPGLFDTGMTNEKVTKEIVKCIGMTSPGPHAMVLVVGISRFTREEQDTVKHFVDHFGEGMLRYMIVLFTRKDELSRSNQSVHQFVQTVPQELKTILHQCGNRYIAFNNDAVGREQETQQREFLDLVDAMVSRNGNACYTSELYHEAEATLQRRMREQREILERQKKQEKDEIRRQVESQFNQKLEKEIIQKSKLEEELNLTKRKNKKTQEEKKEMSKEMESLRQQLKEGNWSTSSRDVEEKKHMELRMESLQQQLRDVEKINYEREQARLQRDLDAIKTRHEEQLKEKDKEISRLSIQKDKQYEKKMATETLRQEERNKVENEKGGAVDDLMNGVGSLISAVVKGVKFVANTVKNVLFK